MKTNRLGGASLGIILSVLVVLFLTGCAGNPSSGKDVVVPKPVITVTVTPATVAYGGSATINCSATNATSITCGTETIAGSLCSVTLKDLVENTTVRVTATGPGGSVSKDVMVTVTAPADPRILLLTTPKGWRWVEFYAGFSAADLKKDSIAVFDKDNTFFFYANNRFYIDYGPIKANPTDPPGGQGDWKIAGDKLTWFGGVWTIVSIDADTLILEQMIGSLDGSPSRLIRYVYKRVQ